MNTLLSYKNYNAAAVAASGGNRKNVPLQNIFLDLKEWESIVGEFSNFR